MSPDPQDEFEMDWGDGDPSMEVWQGDEAPGHSARTDLDDDQVDVVSLGGGDDDFQDFPAYAEQQNQTKRQPYPPQPSTSSPQSPAKTHSNVAQPLSRSSSELGRSLPASLPQRPSSHISALAAAHNPLAASAMAPSKVSSGLLPDWEPRMARSGGGTYYFNVKTGQSAWEKPVAPLASTPTGRPSMSPTARRDRHLPDSPSRPPPLNAASLPPRPPPLTTANAYFRPERSVSPARARARGRSRERSWSRERKRPSEREPRRPVSPPADVKAARRPYSPPPLRGIDSYRPSPSPEPLQWRRISASPPPRMGRPATANRGRHSPTPIDQSRSLRLSPPTNGYDQHRRSMTNASKQPPILSNSTLQPMLFHPFPPSALAPSFRPCASLLFVKCGPLIVTSLQDLGRLHQTDGEDPLAESQLHLVHAPPVH